MAHIDRDSIHLISANLSFTVRSSQHSAHLNQYEPPSTQRRSHFQTNLAPAFCRRTAACRKITARDPTFNLEQSHQGRSELD